MIINRVDLLKELHDHANTFLKEIIHDRKIPKGYYLKCGHCKGKITSKKT